MGDVSGTTNVGTIGAGAPNGQGQLDKVMSQDKVKQVGTDMTDISIQNSISNLADSIKEEAGKELGIEVDKLPDSVLDKLDDIAKEATGGRVTGSIYSGTQRQKEQESQSPSFSDSMREAGITKEDIPRIGRDGVIRRTDAQMEEFFKTRKEQVAQGNAPTRKAPGIMPIPSFIADKPLMPAPTQPVIQPLSPGEAAAGPISTPTPVQQPVNPFDLSSVTNTAYTAPGMGQGTFTSDDTFLQQLGQYLGLGTESQESDILKTLTGSEPESVRPAFEKELKSLEEAGRGFTAGEREALLGQKRQALDAQSRLGGRTKALKGGQRLAALMGAQAGAKSKQASAMEEFDKMQKERKLTAETGLQQAELDIASMDRTRKESYLKNMREAVLSLGNLKGQQRLYKDKE